MQPLPTNPNELKALAASLLGQLQAAFSDPNWATPTTLFTGFAFTGLIYFVFCFGMSRYSLFVERRLNAYQRN